MKSPPAAGAFRSSDAYQHAAARGDSGRAKSILEVLHIEQIVSAAKKRQRCSLGNSPFITPVEIGFGEAGESQLACAERKVILEDWRDVRTRSIQIKAEQERVVSLIDGQAEEVFGNNVLRLESAACDNSITVSECIGSAPVSAAEGRSFEVSFNASRKAAAPVDVAAETSYAQWITHETRKRDHALQMRVKVRHAKSRAILRDPLIEPGISADRLLCLQRRIAKAHEPDLRESAGAESLKQRWRTETVA